MAKVPNTTQMFDAPATVDELIEALREVRDAAGGDAVVHAKGKGVEFSAIGQRVRSITAIPASRNE